MIHRAVHYTCTCDLCGTEKTQAVDWRECDALTEPQVMTRLRYTHTIEDGAVRTVTLNLCEECMQVVCVTICELRGTARRSNA